MRKIYDSITEMIGHTPLLRLHKLESHYDTQAHILAKCEFYNPLFSVKDRVALQIIQDLEDEGKITPKTILVEATSGNTGIALSAICAAKGYNLVIIMPENSSNERITLIKHFGAEIILTPAADGMQGAIAKAEMLAQRNPDVILTDQFHNPSNIKAHQLTTGMEIMEDTGGNIDCLIAAVGTGGTLSGIVSTLKSCNPDLYVVAVEPKESAVLNGKPKGTHHIPGIGAGFIPPLFDKSLVNEIMDIPSDDAVEMAKTVARLEGLPTGISSGASLCACVKIASRPNMQNKNIVVILPSAVERYLSLGYFD
ncbi:MAG: cysteine synthase A [Alphaproteobacteria bacterium]|nr:cysteine synthase A [Alphaproteobacteria bacterium]